MARCSRVNKITRHLVTLNTIGQITINDVLISRGRVPFTQKQGSSYRSLLLFNIILLLFNPIPGGGGYFMYVGRGVGQNYPKS